MAQMVLNSPAKASAGGEKCEVQRSRGDKLLDPA